MEGESTQDTVNRLFEEGKTALELVVIVGDQLDEVIEVNDIGIDMQPIMEISSEYLETFDSHEEDTDSDNDFLEDITNPSGLLKKVLNSKEISFLPRRIEEPQNRIEESAQTIFLAMLTIGISPDALPVLDYLMKVAPDYFKDGAPWSFKAEVYMKEGKYTEGIEWANKAIEIYPCSPEAHSIRGFCKFMLWKSKHKLGAELALVHAAITDIALAIRYHTESGNTKKVENNTTVFYALFNRL